MKMPWSPRATRAAAGSRRPAASTKNTAQATSTRHSRPSRGASFTRARSRRVDARRALKEMIREGQDITRRWEKGSLSSVIDLSDLDLDEDKFMLRISSASEEKNSVPSLLEWGQQMVEQDKGSLAELIQLPHHLDAA